MSTIKTAISLPEPLFKQVDRVASELHISRSRLFSLAAEAYIQQYQNQRLLDAINEAHQGPDEEEKALAEARRRQHRQAVAGEW